MIINDLNTTPASEWNATAEVRVGALNPSTMITLRPGLSVPEADRAPYYKRISATLGGGAVGLAPFTLHDNDGMPTRRQLQAVDCSLTRVTLLPSDFNVGGTNTSVPVKMRFYGPLQVITTSDRVKIECAPLGAVENPCAAPAWQNVSSGFLVRLPTDPLVNDPRTIGLSRANNTTQIGAGLYRVTFPGIGSSGVTGLPGVKVTKYCENVDESAVFYFRVGQDCDGDLCDDWVDFSIPVACETGCADFNGVDGITVADIFDFINAWFAGCTLATGVPPCISSADFNGNHAIEVQDIFEFLNAWFAGTGCD